MECDPSDSIPYVEPQNKKPEFLMSGEEKLHSELITLIDRAKAYAQPVHNEGIVNSNKPAGVGNFRTPEIPVYHPGLRKIMGLEFIIYTPHDERYSPSIKANWMVINGHGKAQHENQPRVEEQVYLSAKHLSQTKGGKPNPTYKQDGLEIMALIENAIDAYEEAREANLQSDF
jgi:hypothetical protein